MFFSKEETLQDRYCDSPIFLHDFISLSVRLGTASPPQGVKPQGLLFQQSAEGCLSLTAARVVLGGGEGGAFLARPCVLLGVFSAADSGEHLTLKGTEKAAGLWPFPLNTRARFSCASSATVGCIQPLPLRIQLRPSPPPSPSPACKNPWVTCYLNEPLARLLWLLTFLNDES